MNLDKFFDLLEIELKQNPKLSKYHRFTNDSKLYNFRKSYLVQRYSFLLKNLSSTPVTILDVGCGYGTTAILLTILGHKVKAVTLEYYFDEIEQRKKYWSQYADLSSLEIEYADFFEYDSKVEQYHHILVIDTLHHLEPFNLAADQLSAMLKPDGSIIVCEENGNNLIMRLKNFKLRGFKRVISYYDEKLKKQITFGNENTRSLAKWKKEFSSTPLKVVDSTVEYIRFYMPSKHNKITNESIIEKENLLWKKNSFVREFFFFGINFIMKK